MVTRLALNQQTEVQSLHPVLMSGWRNGSAGGFEPPGEGSAPSPDAKVPWSRGEAAACKAAILRFESGRNLCGVMAERLNARPC